MGSPTDQRVGRVGEGVGDVVTDQVTVFVLQDRKQQVFDHLRVNGTYGPREWNGGERDTEDKVKLRAGEAGSEL